MGQRLGFAQRMMTLATMFSLVYFTACMTPIEEGPSDEELAELDGWASASDGKADMPTSWSELVEWLRDVYQNQMSAIWNNQEHLATPAAALDRVRAVLARAGVTDPAAARFPVTVQRHVAQVDHSEINIALPGGTVMRLVGDPKGAGAFVDRSLFKIPVGPKLCLTWSELQAAISAAYVGGAYGASYVCHTVTERVLRAIGVGTAIFSSKFRTYASARWIWGPRLPSFNSPDPADWTVSRACP